MLSIISATCLKFDWKSQNSLYVNSAVYELTLLLFFFTLNEIAIYGDCKSLHLFEHNATPNNFIRIE